MDKLPELMPEPSVRKQLQERNSLLSVVFKYGNLAAHPVDGPRRLGLERALKGAKDRLRYYYKDHPGVIR